MKRNIELSYWFYVIGILLMLVGGGLFSEGMFVDGVTYASISRNMAEGQGSFWDPFYTQTLYPHFRQHPPLAMGMEALMFIAFGDYLFIEKLYSLLMFIVSGVLITLIWKRINNSFDGAWLPLLYWIAVPLVTWSAVNNMLENTMAIFVLLSVYLMIISYQKSNKIWLLLSGVSLFAAFLTKGFTGIFPLVFPLIYCIFDEKQYWIKGLNDILLLFVTLVVLTGLMFGLFPPSLSYIKDYINIQVIGGGMYEATVTNRFYIVLRLLEEQIGPVLILLALFVIQKLILKNKENGVELKSDNSRWFFVFLILGLSGVLPIMVSVKQSGFYMVTALPFFALAFGFVSVRQVNSICQAIRPNRYRRMIVIGLSYVMLVCGLLMPLTGINKYCRDEALIESIKDVLSKKGDEPVIGIAPMDYQKWAWHAYFMRYGKISLDPNRPIDYELNY